MCKFCDEMKKRVGYQGQKYVVYFTRDEVEKVFGWQNEPTGGLLKVAKLMPGVTSARIEEVHHGRES